MKNGHDKADDATSGIPTRRDSGSTFIELLVAVVLLGTVVVGVLAATRATLIGSVVEREHSRSQQWLQSAIGVLDGTPLVPCDLEVPPTGTGSTDGSHIVAEYEAVLPNAPSGWEATSATIEIDSLQVWDGEAFVSYSDQNALTPPECYDDSELRQQLITIRVTGPDGSVQEEIEVIKRDLSGG